MERLFLNKFARTEKREAMCSARVPLRIPGRSSIVLKIDINYIDNNNCHRRSECGYMFSW